jgi:signal transduction histidine kinase
MGHAPRLPEYATNALTRSSRYFRGLTWPMFGAFWLIMLAVNSVQLLHLLSGRPDFTQMPEENTQFLAEFYDIGYQIQFTLQRTVETGLFFLPSLLCMIVALNLELNSAARRIFALVIAILVGTLVGQASAGWVERLLYASYATADASVPRWEPPIVYGIADWLRGFTTAGIAAALLYVARRDSDAAARLHQEELDRVSLDRQMAEARLQVLQAQIEPHFLFNTLASVRRLYEIDPPSGKSMLQHLRGYLAAALPEMRVSQSTLGRELALTLAYLNVQKIRMGERLTFAIEVPESLTATAFPPMVLLTLVENAIKHGLAPLPEGGSIAILARERAGALQLQVRDDGAGFRSASGAGIGLANTRTRLATLYGNAGRLALEQNVPRGVTATVELPVDKVAAAIFTT